MNLEGLLGPECPAFFGHNLDSAHAAGSFSTRIPLGTSQSLHVVSGPRRWNIVGQHNCLEVQELKLTYMRRQAMDFKTSEDLKIKMSL